MHTRRDGIYPLQILVARVCLYLRFEVVLATHEHANNNAEQKQDNDDADVQGPNPPVVGLHGVVVGVVGELDAVGPFGEAKPKDPTSTA